MSAFSIANCSLLYETLRERSGALAHCELRIVWSGDGVFQIGKTDDGRWGISETYAKNSRDYFMKSDCIQALESLECLEECLEQVSFMLSQQ